MFWTREIVGWIMLGLGLWAFYICYFLMLKNGHIVESGPMLIMGIFLFRGGLHLIKVAVAARICQTKPPEPKATPRSETLAPRRGSPIPGKRVVPGK